MQKNQAVQNRLQEAVKEFHEEAKPAKGLKSSDIRHVQRTVPDADKYQDMNVQDLSREDVNAIARRREQAAEEVTTYENAVSLPPIEGVYLHFDRHGV